MIEKRAQTKQPIHELIASRWSPRAFDSTRQVKEDDVIRLLEAARWAPSCMGDEPWRFIVFDKFRNEDAWQKDLHTLSERNQMWAKNASLLVLVLASDYFSESAKPNRWGAYDAGAAAMNFLLQATALGLASHPMGGFDSPRVLEEFAVPSGLTPMAIMAAGYAAEADVLHGDFREREYAPRTRKPLAQNFFHDVWGNGVTR